MTTAALQSHLQAVAGVTPSPTWLHECWSALQRNGSLANKSLDAVAGLVLEQILSHDMRDVVRKTTDASSRHDTVPSPPPSHAAVQLRRAIRDSQASENRAVILPASFRLLVQLDECVNVASNAEGRLAEPTSANTAWSKNACWKICYTDGYKDTTAAAAAAAAPLVALTVTPLEPFVSTASTTTAAGTKILLVGPLSIRHGLAAWHASNAFVLGGRVERLVTLQQQARRRAQQQSGHGLDPTIKALIWNPDDTAGDEQDEAERASEDVPSATAIVTPMAPPPQARVPPVPTTQTTRPAPVNRGALSLHPTPVARSVAPNGPAPIRALGGPLQHPPVTRAAPSHAAPLGPPAAAAAPAVRTVGPTRNPYPAVRSPVIRTALDTAPPIAHPQTAFVTAHGTAVRSTLHGVTAARHGTQAVSTVPLQRPPTQTLAPTLVQASWSSPAPHGPTFVTWVQWRTILHRAVQDRAVYEQVYPTTYTVTLKQKGVKLHFNIDKKRVHTDNGKGEKQYEYVMIAKFGDDQDDNVVTCLVSSTILEPHFPIAPSEMRKLNRQDRVKADTLVRNGGISIQQSLHQLATYDVKLHLSPSDYFDSATRIAMDGDQPFLVLMSRR